MKALRLIVLIITTTSLISCGDSINKQPATSNGFEAIEKEIKSKFGANAYYTDLSITYNKSIGNIINVTVTEKPELLKMAQWNYTQGTWRQISKISLEVPEKSKAKSLMFQLNKKINLARLGELVERSSHHLSDKENIPNPILTVTSVLFPDDGDTSKAAYLINLQSENGGSTFSYSYSLNGNLLKIDE